MPIEHKFINEVECKYCFSCRLYCPITNYNKNRALWDGLQGSCNDCRKIMRNKYRDYNIAYGEKYRKKHKKKMKKYFKKHYQNNKERINKRNLAYIRAHPQRRIARNMRCRINKALKYNVKSARTQELLGCTIEEFMKHLESQFEEGMTWKNNTLKNGWHVDHIVPCDWFDLSDPEQQKLCFHFTNLQPMWGDDNMSKNNRVTTDTLIKHFQTLCN